MSAYSHQGVVYFVVRGNHVKIGYTAADIRKRLAHLSGCRSKLIQPDDFDATRPVRLLHTIPGCVMRDERRIQGLFAAHHAAGEWFHMTPEFLLHLTRLQYVTYAESLRRFRRARADLKRSPITFRQEAAA